MKRIWTVLLICLIAACAAGLAACGGTAVEPATPEAPGTPSDGENPGLPEETPDDIAAAYEQFRAALEQNADRYSLTLSLGEGRTESKLTAKAAGDRVHLYMTYPDYIWPEPVTVTEEIALLFDGGFVYVRDLSATDDPEPDELIYAPEVSPDFNSFAGTIPTEWLPEGFFPSLWDAVTVTDGALTFAFGDVADGTLVFEDGTAVAAFAVVAPYYGDRIPVRMTIGGLGTTEVTFPFADGALIGGFTAVDRRFAEMERVLASDSAHVYGTAVLDGVTADIEYRLSDGAVLGEVYAGETMLARDMLIKREDAYFRFDGDTPDYSAMSVQWVGTTVGDWLLSALSAYRFESGYFALADGREDRVVLSAAGREQYVFCDDFAVDCRPDGTYVADIALNADFAASTGAPLERLTLTFADIGKAAEIAFPPEYVALTEFYRDGILYAPTGEGTVQVAEVVNTPVHLVIPAEITAGGTAYAVTGFDAAVSRFWAVESVVLPVSVTSLNDVFAGADELKYVYYEGTPAQYAAVTGKTFGDEAPVVYYYAAEAPASGNGWHWNGTKTAAVRWPGGEEAGERYQVLLNAGIGGWMPDNRLYVSVIETAPVPEAGENYIFVGWYTDMECTPGNEVIFPYTVTEETMLYGKWEYLRVEFEPNGEGDGYILAMYESERTEITVPAEYNGLPVTGIGADAFGWSHPTHITLPDTVEHIADGAFSHMPDLLYVYIPASVTFIGYDAFRDCGKLVLYCEAASAPAGWTDNGWNPDGRPVVWDCGSNDEADDGKVYFESDGIRYALSENAAVAEYAVFDLTEALIPGSVSYGGDTYPVTEIGAYAFANGVLTRVEIPDTVTAIGEGAFAWNEGLTEVTIPGSVTAIGAGAFAGCHALLLYCEAASAPAGWAEYWNGGCPVIWDSNNNDEAEDGSVYAEIGGMRYALSDGTATVFDGGAADETVVTVPASVSYEGRAYTVTGIGAYAFYGSAAASLSLPDSVTAIGAYAIYGCFNLTELRIPDGVAELPDNAVGHCYSLKRISLPAGLERCGMGVFGGLHNLKEAEFRGTLAQWCAADGVGRVLSQQGDVTLYIDGAAVAGELVIPDGTVRIGENAFYGCLLTKVTIPDSVTEIGAGAFSGCYALILYCEAASAPDGWAEYWNGYCPVVWDCNNNDEADDGNVYVVQDGLRYALRDGEASVAEQRAAGDVTVAAAVSYKGRTYPVTAVAAYAFSDCEALASVTLPDSVTEIGAGAFQRCHALQSVVFGAGLTHIGDYAFAWTSLASVTLPDSVAEIGDFAFQYCHALQSVVFGAGLMHIGDYAFAGTSLASVTLPDGLLEIGYGAFAGCPLTEIRIPGSVKNVGEGVFSGTSLTRVVLEEGVEQIGNNAFERCHSLASIVIPASVREIGAYAFYGCTDLAEAAFAEPDGWQVSQSADGTDAEAVPDDLADGATAAECLRERYAEFRWTRV